MKRLEDPEYLKDVIDELQRALMEASRGQVAFMIVDPEGDVKFKTLHDIESLIDTQRKVNEKQ